jgi:hypothetical protein
MWGVKPFIQGNWWNGVGKTIIFGEWAQYEDMGRNIGTSGTGLTACPAGLTCTITGSELDRFGVGLVQEIDAAAMHLWLRYQGMDVDVNLRDSTGTRRNQGFDDFSLIQGGGIWFF